MNFLEKGKKLYWWLVATFAVLYLAIAAVSTIHAVSFFQLSNIFWLAVLLGVAYEVGQATVLFSILMTENKNKFMPWVMMFALTALQITANVYASFKFMDSSLLGDWEYWKRSILFSVKNLDAEMYKVIISWISGALLPLIALGMTALVAENIRIMSDKKQEEEKPKEELEEIINNEVEKRLSERDIEASTGEEDIDGKGEIEEAVVMSEKDYNEKIKRKSESGELKQELIAAKEKKNEALDTMVDKVKSDDFGEIENDVELEAASLIDLQNTIDEEEKEAKEEEKIYDLSDLERATKDIKKDFKKESSDSEMVTNDIEKPKEEPKVVEVEKPEGISSVSLKLETKTVDSRPSKLEIKEDGKTKVVPVNKVRGWHLKKEYIDNEGNLFKKGVYSHTLESPSKKA